MGARVTAPTRTSTGGSQLDTLLRGAARETRDSGGGARGIPTLLCASGCGGSGATLLSALLAMAAAGDGYRVLLVDADEMVGPLAMLLRVTPRATWQDLRGGRVQSQEIATPISTTLTLVAGGAARAHAYSTPLTPAERRACMRRVHTLADGMDLVVIDCGARFDAVRAAITPHADEHMLAITASGDPVSLAATFALCKAAHAHAGALSLDLLVNRHDESSAARCFDVVDAGARQFLGCSLRYAGAIPMDDTLDVALRAGMPFPDAASGSPAAMAAHAVVTRLLAGASLSRSGT